MGNNVFDLCSTVFNVCAACVHCVAVDRMITWKWTNWADAQPQCADDGRRIDCVRARVSAWFDFYYNGDWSYIIIISLTITRNIMSSFYSNRRNRRQQQQQQKTQSILLLFWFDFMLMRRKDVMKSIERMAKCIQWDTACQFSATWTWLFNLFFYSPRFFASSFLSLLIYFDNEFATSRLIYGVKNYMTADLRSNQKVTFKMLAFGKRYIYHFDFTFEINREMWWARSRHLPRMKQLKIKWEEKISLIFRAGAAQKHVARSIVPAMDGFSHCLQIWHRHESHVWWLIICDSIFGVKSRWKNKNFTHTTCYTI